MGGAEWEKKAERFTVENIKMEAIAGRWWKKLRHKSRFLFRLAFSERTLNTTKWEL